MSKDSLPEASARVLSGSCLCGGIAYLCEGPLRSLARCYCVQCRKQSGGENATNAEPIPGSLRIVRGQDLVRRFESSPGQFREFCGTCGSPLWKRYAADPDRVRLRLGLLDVEIEERPTVQVFAAEKMAMTAIDRSIPTADRGFTPQH